MHGRAIEASQTADRLGDIRWMLQTVDTLTLAGQSHELKKIAGLLEEEALHCRPHRCASMAETIESLLAALRQEARRLLPDVRSFAQRAETLIGVVQDAL
jgi:hypothetical protein